MASKNERPDPVIDCSKDVDRTKQEFKDECDMNNILKHIDKTQFVPLAAQDSLRRQVFADVSAAPGSLEEAYEIAERADEAFAALPAAVRDRFGGMENVLKWVEDPANKKEAQDLGLLSKDALDVPAALANAAKEGAPSAPQTLPAS